MVCIVFNLLCDVMLCRRYVLISRWEMCCDDMFYVQEYFHVVLIICADSYQSRGDHYENNCPEDMPTNVNLY